MGLIVFAQLNLNFGRWFNVKNVKRIIHDVKFNKIMIYTKHNLTDTIVALATPPGVGAIGVIRLSGKHAITIADSIFFGKNLEKQASHTAHFWDDSGN